MLYQPILECTRYKHMKLKFTTYQKTTLFIALVFSNTLFSQHELSFTQKLKRKWFVSTNFTSLFRNSHFLLFEESQMQTTNRFITIEPEVIQNNQVSLRFPICIGINYFKNGHSTDQKYNTYYYYLLNDGFYNTNVHPYFSPKYTQHSYTVQKGDIPTKKSLHKQDLIFQIGINPKLYIPEQRNVSIYFSPSLSIGLMDSYALDYYHSFKGSTSSSGYNIWSWDKETIVYHHNPFLYARVQTTLGLEIQLGNKFSLDFETGISSFVTGEGKKDDHVYMSLNGGDYQQIYTDFNPNQLFKPVPIHFINRLLLRMTIN